MNKKMAREIVESLPSLYPLMTADEEEAIWTVLATNSNTENDGDYISRQQAIDAIENAFDRETILNRFVRKIAISAVRLLPSAQSEQRWIPITERLPKKQAKVLVVDFGEVDTAYLNSEGRWMDFNGDKLKDVKAWMPLPKWEGVNSEND